MTILDTSLPGVKIIEPTLFRDRRGYFLEIWNWERYASVGIKDRFVQDNMSYSMKGVLRGLHLQHPRGQAKLVYVLSGMIVDVAVDVRIGSPTFGRATTVELSETNRRQVYIPVGFAHGFAVTTDFALVAYKCGEPYHPPSEVGIAWNDPDISIEWPSLTFTVSPRDAAFPRLRDIARDKLPSFASQDA